MAKYVSGRQKNLKVGISSYSENLTSLEIVGNVGINTTNATAPLDVLGGAIFRGSSPNELVRITQIGTGPAFIVEDSENPDVTPFLVTTEGKVAIGVAAGGISTSYKLEVNGGDIRFVSGSKGDLIISHQDLVSNIRAAGNIQLGLGANGGDAIRINLNNNIGFGTTNPTSKLYVVGDGYFTGVVTASTFSGNAATATYATSAGISTYSGTAGIATYATSAGIATNATYSGTSGIATYAGTAGIATNATYATSAGIATYATSSGIATYATSAGIATNATYSGTAGIATYAVTAGIATYATSAGIATHLKGGSGGTIVYQSATDTTAFLSNGTSGQILQSNGGTAAPSWVNAAPAGAITGLTIRDEGNIVGSSNSVSQINFVGNIVTATASAGIATITFLDYVSNSGVATYAGTSGIATYATSAGIATNVIGGIASVTQLNVTGITTLGVTSATNFTSQQINISGISTIGNLQITPVGTGATVGSVGVLTYYGDGSKLSGISAGVGVNDDTTTNSTYYVGISTITTGTLSSLVVSSTKLTFNPSTGNLVAGGTVTANSDRKLKTNIKTIDNALHKVLSLRGVEFDRIDTGDHQIGVIAQEVEQIIPDVVYGEETKSVAYANLVGLLIEAIKEQNKEIQELKIRLGER